MNTKEFFKNKKITIMGLGLLGRGIGDTKFLAEQGADLIVTDLKSKYELKSSLKQLKKYKNIKYTLGKHRLQDFKGRDMILKAAGVPLKSPYIVEAKKNKIPIEMSASLFAKLSGATIIGITGTRGKTTVTHLIHQILKKQRQGLRKNKGLAFVKHSPNVLLGGNIKGISTLALLDKVNPSADGGDIIVMELDSWQLQGFGDSKISPHIAVFTNLLSDHMNYYGNSMTKYFKDKANIFKYQSKSDYLIAGKEISKTIKSKFKIKGKLIIPKPLPKSWKLKIAGEHNRKNIALAVEATRALGVPEKTIKKVAENFKGVEGRLELIKTIRGIKIYNDTTATTPDATIAALYALSKEPSDVRRPNSDVGRPKVILIIGGADKGLDMSELMKEIPKYCKAVILLAGTGTEKLNLEFRILNNERRKNPDSKFPRPTVSAGLGKIQDSKTSYCKANNLKSALSLAMKNAKQNDIVLFSPAFASFGMFKNEYDRGEQFNKLVSKLK